MPLAVSHAQIPIRKRFSKICRSRRSQAFGGIAEPVGGDGPGLRQNERGGRGLSSPACDRRTQKHLGPLVGTVLQHMLLDSSRRHAVGIFSSWGYDLKPFLPIFAQRVVGSEEEKKKFLGDYDPTIADLSLGGRKRRQGSR